MFQRRRPLTLLEVVIGFALTAILLAFLFSSFHHMAELGIKVQKAREAVHSRGIVQLRLSQMFEKIILEEKTPTFYCAKHPESNTEALYFTFDNGIDHDPIFCGTIQAALFLNTKKQLCLSLIRENTQRKDVLYSPANYLSIECFNPKEKNWHAGWTGNDCPPIVRLKLDSAITFTFLLPEDA